MPKLVKQVPKYRRHATGQAFVVINKRAICLGEHGTAESRRESKRIIGEWLADDRQSPIEPGPGTTVSEVCAAFLRHAKRHYVKNGEITDEVDSCIVVKGGDGR